MTLIEGEEIERFNADHHRTVRAGPTRTIIVARGPRLAEFAGRVFRIGRVRLRGIELREPCLILGRNLVDSAMQPADVVRA